MTAATATVRGVQKLRTRNKREMVLVCIRAGCFGRKIPQDGIARIGYAPRATVATAILDPNLCTGRVKGSCWLSVRLIRERESRAGCQGCDIDYPHKVHA